MSNGTLAIIFGGAVVVAALTGLIQFLPIGPIGKKILGLWVLVAAMALSLHLFRAMG